MKPPVFIAVKASEGAGAGYVRADQIEGVYAGGETHKSAQTRIRTFTGFDIFTDEPFDQVFAKMADALNVDPVVSNEPLVSGVYAIGSSVRVHTCGNITAELVFETPGDAEACANVLRSARRPTKHA